MSPTPCNRAASRSPGVSRIASTCCMCRSKKSTIGQRVRCSSWRTSLLAAVVNTSGVRGLVSSASSSLATTSRASATEAMNGIRVRSKRSPGNWISSALPIVSALMPVLSERKNTGTTSSESAAAELMMQSTLDDDQLLAQGGDGGGGEAEALGEVALDVAVLAAYLLQGCREIAGLHAEDREEQVGVAAVVAERVQPVLQRGQQVGVGEEVLLQHRVLRHAGQQQQGGRRPPGAVLARRTVEQHRLVGLGDALEELPVGGLRRGQAHEVSVGLLEVALRLAVAE